MPLASLSTVGARGASLRLGPGGGSDPDSDPAAAAAAAAAAPSARPGGPAYRPERLGGNGPSHESRSPAALQSP